MKATYLLPLHFPADCQEGSQWEIYTVQFPCGAGCYALIFPITFKRTFVGRLLHKGTKTEILVLFQREKDFSLRGFIARISESYPANESVVIQKGGREIPSRVAREHRATTIPNEMRHVERARAVAVQLSSEMTDG